MRRDDICLYLGPADRAQLEALRANRNTPRKVVRRTGIVLATADGCGSNEILRRADTSGPTVRRWQERNLETAIYEYPLQHNVRPKPFARTKSAEDILTRERRALNALDEIRGNR